MLWVRQAGAPNTAYAGEITKIFEGRNEGAFCRFPGVGTFFQLLCKNGLLITTSKQEILEQALAVFWRRAYDTSCSVLCRSVNMQMPFPVLLLIPNIV